MMSLWDALRMNMMISYQELVRTFPSYPLIILNKNAIIEVMAFLKKLELSNLAYQRVVNHIPPPCCIVISTMSDF